MLFMTILLGAVYSVPVPDGLRGYAEFALDAAHLRLGADGGSLSYRLPRALDGGGTARLHLRSERGGDPRRLAAPEADAICAPAADGAVACRVRYRPSFLAAIDPAKARRWMERQGYGAERVAGILAVGEALGHEAEGVIAFPRGAYSE